MVGGLGAPGVSPTRHPHALGTAEPLSASAPAFFAHLIAPEPSDAVQTGWTGCETRLLGMGSLVARRLRVGRMSTDHHVAVARGPSGTADDVAEVLSGDRLLFEEGGDDGVEGVSGCC